MNNNILPAQQRQSVAVPFEEMERMAVAIAKSGLFGMKTPDQALALMAISQAEGRHPALAARDYDIIQGRSAKKAEAMLRDFMESGGKVEWHELTDIRADATFSHPFGGSARITWDTDRAKQAGLLTKDMYKKYPRQMLRSRVVSEGVRTIYPAATSGMYVPEEVADFDVKPIAVVQPLPPKATPSSPQPIYDDSTGEVSQPHRIPVTQRANGDGSDWITWGRTLIGALMASTNWKEAEAWLDNNDDALANCLVHAPKAHGSITKAVGQVRARWPEPEIQDGEEPLADWLTAEEAANEQGIV